MIKKKIASHSMLPHQSLKVSCSERKFFSAPSESQTHPKIEKVTQIFGRWLTWVKFSQMYHGQATKGTAHEYSTTKFQFSHTSQDYHTIIS